MTTMTIASPSVTVERDDAAGWDADPLGTYLREIGRQRLLTAEQEVELGRRIASGNRDEATEEERRDGKRAADEMAEANLRFVVMVAKHYRHPGLPLAELIAEGNVGLLKAVQRFDHTRGFRFSSYAVWWIRQAITQAIRERSRTIRVPVHISEEIARRSKAASQLRNELGRDPTRSEIDEAAGRASMGLNAGLAVYRPPISLASTVDEEDGGDPLIDRLPPDPDVEATSEIAGHALLSREMRAAMIDALTARECAVLRLRYGLDGDAPLTREAIGARLGVGRERVAQIEHAALRKLRHPAVAARLL